MNVKIYIIIFIVIVALLIIFFARKKNYFGKPTEIQNPAPEIIEPEERPIPKVEPISLRYSKINSMLGEYEELVKSWKKYVKKHSNVSLGEFICKTTLETIFDAPFPNKRYKFLENPDTGAPLELDGYNEDLGLAFEFQGDQHSNFPNRYHKTKLDEEKFREQCKRDLFKKQRCTEEKIELLFIYDDMDYQEIPQYIAGIIPVRFDKFRVDLVSE